MKALAHKRVDVVSAAPVSGLSLTKQRCDVTFPPRPSRSCESDAAGLNDPRQE